MAASEEAKTVARIDGTIGDQWRWTASYGRGIYRDDSSFPNDRIPGNYAKAIDSVPMTRDYMLDWEREHSGASERAA